ncbi:hypothetical protein LTR48_001434 [Friedmanniomyces endolithicus]|uniref:alpha-glucosidase n=1 Tax=Rachicladosporium monterosium TaxID=1507873 RepID=A0ABR0L4N5_9PEZI|nr:hypothetical protein LTR48_001434 [Friedmanniomyces endolithicus]KAK5143462.1 hypothetical protein LTR32_004406 [Rachicladosporium monterosium]
MVDPAAWAGDYCAYNKCVSDGAFLKDANGFIYQGVVWPGPTAFPDWFEPRTQGYWNGQFSSFFDPITGVDTDALWIDMNEASNFCNAYTFANGDIADGAVALTATNYPIWNAVVDLPCHTTIIYRYLRQESGGSYISENSNRTPTTGACNETTQTTHDTITTASRNLINPPYQIHDAASNGGPGGIRDQPSPFERLGRVRQRHAKPIWHDDVRDQQGRVAQPPPNREGFGDHALHLRGCG